MERYNICIQRINAFGLKNKVINLKTDRNILRDGKITMKKFRVHRLLIRTNVRNDDFRLKTFESESCFEKKLVFNKYM